MPVAAAAACAAVCTSLCPAVCPAEVTTCHRAVTVTGGERDLTISHVSRQNPRAIRTRYTQHRKSLS